MAFDEGVIDKNDLFMFPIIPLKNCFFFLEHNSLRPNKKIPVKGHPPYLNLLVKAKCLSKCIKLNSFQEKKKYIYM